MRYRGLLYRALNPVFAREPLSGRGAQLYGGRFNAKGTPALYASLSIMTAIREVNQVGSLQPTTLVSYEADLDPVFDGRDEAALRAHGMDANGLADPTWRDAMRANGIAPTQAFARQLVNQAYQGFLVRSFAPGATAADLNVVLWHWGSDVPAQLVLIDDEKRLSGPLR